MEKLIITMIGIILFQTLIIIDMRKRNKILYNNYHTALNIIAEQDPKLKTYLESKENNYD